MPREQDSFTTVTNDRTGSAGDLPASIGGRYRVQSRLGSGGMAVVYRVLGPPGDTPLALKQLTLSGDRARDQHALSLFEREFYTLAQLSHPSVIRVHDYGVDQAGPFYTMDLLDGGDIRELAPLGFQIACRYMLEVCSSLALLHSRRLVHRDVSPRNVRCTRDGHAKLLDFGAMIPMGHARRIVGTPAFVAPEVVHRSTLDGRADLFSLGATLYYALTGQAPFPVREFGQLQNAWRRAPSPPSASLRDVPPALDHLVASLLRIDPAERPCSAFEVMERLAAVAGIEHAEPVEVSHGYLSTPTLVGRDAMLRTFRVKGLQVVDGGRGASVLILGAPGMGRSRALDACVLDAKTHGLTVSRVSANDSGPRPLGCIRRLCEQLFEQLPPGNRTAPPELGGAKGSSQHPNRDVRAAAVEWLLHVSREQPLLLAIDDAHRIDEHSVAVLAALTRRASDRPLLILGTADGPVADNASPTFRLFEKHCAGLHLLPLTLDQTETLLASVFGDVPNVSLLSDRVHRIAEGRPRAMMTLAQHVVDKGLVRYERGRWTLPADLATAELPANADEALESKLAELPGLSRHLAEAHALCHDDTMTHEDYAVLAGSGEGKRLDEAISELIAREIIIDDGQTYAFAQQGFASLLRATMSSSEARQRHRALAQLEEHRHGHHWRIADHWLRARELSLALEQLRKISVENRELELASAGMPADAVAAALSTALDLIEAEGASTRDGHHVRELMVAISVVTDGALFYRAAPAVLAQLEADSGLSAYRALDPELDGRVRLQRALQIIAERADSPGAEPIYGPLQAIQALARYVTAALVFGTDAQDVGLLSSLPGLLEPFVELSPLLNALWQTAIATSELLCRGRACRPRERFARLYRELEAQEPERGELVARIRHGVVLAIGSMEASLGLKSAAEWIEVLDGLPNHKMNAMYLRRVLCLQQGDAEGAARFSKEAELLAAQTKLHQSFDFPLRLEMREYMVARDLAGIRQVADRIREKAAVHPGWMPFHDRTEGFFQALRGDFSTALAMFERCLRAVSSDKCDGPRDVDGWLGATQGAIWCLTELGRAREAVVRGRDALARCDELEIDCWHDVVIRELSIAEARSGEIDVAVRRIDALIQSQRDLGITGLHIAVSYETRARIAIYGKDPDAVAKYMELASDEYAANRGSGLGPSGDRIREEARLAGLEDVLAQTKFTSTVLGVQAQVSPSLVARVRSEFESLSAAQRPMHALVLLCRAADADSGHLYLAQRDGVALAATYGERPPDSALTRFVVGYFTQYAEDQSMTTALTYATKALTPIPELRWVHSDGTEHRVLPLFSDQLGRAVPVGLAVLPSDNGAASSELTDWMRAIAAELAAR